MTVEKATQALNSTAPLCELRTALNAGIGFYQDAASKIDSIALRVVFESMARVRKDFVAALKNEATDQTAVSHSIPRPLDAGHLYQPVTENLTTEPAGHLIQALVALEGSLATAVREQIALAREDGDQRLAEILRVHLLRLQVCMDELDRLQKRLH